MDTHLISRLGPLRVESGNAVCRSHNILLLSNGLTLTYFILPLTIMGNVPIFLSLFSLVLSSLAGK